MSKILLPGLNDMSAEMICGLCEESVSFIQISTSDPGTWSRK